MNILIDGRPAVLAEDMTFDYISENRLFTDSDDYSLSLTFQLADCSENLQIFGNINRADVRAGKVVFDCVLQDPALIKTGALVITEITEAEVTAQFLAGRAADNYDTTLDDVFINELVLGEWPCKDTRISPEQAWNPDMFPGRGVALPWVNDASGNIQNCFITKSDGTIVWHEDTQGLSWQPYLLDIAKAIVQAIGYTADFSAWEGHKALRWLLLCNTLPSAWQITEFARALPHWSVKEFFCNLEPLLGAEFEFEHKAKEVTMIMLDSANEQLQNMVQIDDILEEHTTELDVIDPETQYRGAKNIVFADRSDTEWKYESCDWFLEENKGNAVRFATLSELLNEAKALRSWDGTGGHRGTQTNTHKLLYAENVDTYFVLRAEDKQLLEDRWPDRPNRYVYTLRPQPLNQLGGRVSDHSDEAEELKLEICPVRKEFTGIHTSNSGEGTEDFGRMMFLSPADYGEAYGEVDGTILAESVEDHIKEINESFYQPAAAAILEKGDRDNKQAYYDKLFIGFWEGTRKRTFINPLPETARYEPNDLMGVTRSTNSLNPGDESGIGTGIYFDIKPGVKVTFKFLSDKLPDVRSLFLIRGKRYLCGKLTASLGAYGMSQLIKGEFYPLAEGSDIATSSALE